MGSQSERSIGQPFSMQTLARSLFRWRLMIRPTPNVRHSVFLRLASRSFLKSMGVSQYRMRNNAAPIACRGTEKEIAEVDKLPR